MKRILVAFLLVFAILLGTVAFVGCDDSKNRDDEDEEEEEEEEEEDEETKKATKKPSKKTETNKKTEDEDEKDEDDKDVDESEEESEEEFSDEETEESDEESEENGETEEGEEIVETEETQATKKPVASAHDVKYYQLRKFVKPIWAGEVCYAEAAFVRENEEGIIEPIQLLYDIDEIISVRNSALNVLYKEGEDYNITSDGKLEIIPSGKIPVLSYSDYYFPFTAEEHAVNQLSTKFPSTKAGWGYIRAEQTSSDPGMSKWTLAVTYKHSEASVITPPADKSAKFERVIKMLENKEKVNIVSLGDSITYGWSSSMNANMDPYCPSYSNIVKDYMNVIYRTQAENTNLSVSGQNTDWALKHDSKLGYVPIDRACDREVDLFILAFGMNDGCGMDPQTYIQNINKIISKIETTHPDACIVVVGTMLPNKLLSWSPGGESILKYHSQYVRVLQNAEKNWTNAAFADVTTVHTEMLERKAYQDTTGSNTNHPNDYIHRVYAQVIIQTIFGEIK